MDATTVPLNHSVHWNGAEGTFQQRHSSAAADDTKLPHISSGESQVLAALICFPAAVRLDCVEELKQAQREKQDVSHGNIMRGQG